MFVFYRGSGWLVLSMRVNEGVGGGEVEVGLMSPKKKVVVEEEVEEVGVVIQPELVLVEVQQEPYIWSETNLAQDDQQTVSVRPVVRPSGLGRGRMKGYKKKKKRWILLEIIGWLRLELGPLSTLFEDLDAPHGGNNK